MSNLASFITEELSRRGWSQSDLAARSGLGTTTIFRILDGESNVKASNLVKIAEALEVDFWKLMILAGYPAPDGSTEAQELIASFPWLEEFGPLLAELKPEQRAAVRAYIRLLQEQTQSPGKADKGRST